MPAVAWKQALENFDGQVGESDLLRAPFVQLFDLSMDLHEDNNLASQHPERVAEMVALLQKQVAEGRSTPGPKLSNDAHVRIVNINDKRLPEIVRRRVE